MQSRWKPCCYAAFRFRRWRHWRLACPGFSSISIRLLSEDIGKANFLAGDFTAEERLAAFLIDLSRRYAARGLSATRFRLTMARTDIANYLRLAAETVSRILKRFQDDDLLRVDRREIELLEKPQLEDIARNVLRT